MSCIYFHSPSGEAKVRGAERAHFGVLTHDTSIDLLLSAVPPRELRAKLDPKSMASGAVGPYGVNERMLSLALGSFGDMDPAFVIEGKPVDHWQLLLNTLIERGSDGMRLATRIHAQCEIHGYVEGPDRAWLADLIATARSEGLFRAEMGWESVIELLTARNDEPVVMSYSVCDSFPNRSASTWVPEEGDEDREGWFGLSAEEQWRTGMEWLHTDCAERGLRLHPSEWSDYRFGHCFTVADLVSDRVKS